MLLNSMELKNFLIDLCAKKIQSINLDEHDKKVIMLLSQEVMKNTENYELDAVHMGACDPLEGVLWVI